ncbi:DapH/DapD/GlmU-related protein [Rhodococcus sp. IEGM 1370]|uniref:serine O-acetyltransferase n=1 Tax=Rhodococcus sp. IEGM 1370 TaxID=3082222 RepID=UPI00295491DB|nr:DapH/DapD/GlmU-related protein [Rhodococcus sp. IEGM 1370]MDV8077560.1 DapH/DapD/GlmU-related protein [Rhodococcus sp. IEGM 1370]
MVEIGLRAVRADMDIWRGFFTYLRRDFERYVPNPALGRYSMLRIFVVHPGARSTALLRLQENSPLSRFGILKTLIRSLNLFLTGADFVPGCVIGPGLMMQHPNGIVVGSTVSAGAKLTVLQQVTIGESISSISDLSNPIIGNEVLLGAGSRILGGVKIGNNAKVGANAVVLIDVPDSATAVGIPARIAGTSEA